MIVSFGRAVRRICIPVLALAVAGCITQYRDHGYMPNDEDLAKISVGRDTRDSVTEAVGTPGVSGVLNNDGYYYVASRMRNYGATAPKEVSREVLAISFDSRGIVRNIERFGLEQGRVIALNRRVTDNGETDRTFIRQLLGNLGNIGPGAILDN